MTHDKNIKTALPALRFPEFRESGEWEETTLGEVCNITNGKSNAQDHEEGGAFPLFDRSDVIKATNNYLFDCEAVIIPGEGMRFVPKYYKGKFNLHQRAYALKDFSCKGSFAYYTMCNRSELLAAKAVRSTVLSLRLPILQNFPIQIPNDISEQQKIADCLTSLDDLITAVADKIKALREHKKGLMQQLFPAEGKTTPALRFPEFKDSGEWEEKNGNKIFEQISNKNHNSDLPILAITQEYGAIPRDKIDYTVIVTDKSIESYKVVEIDDFIISLRSFQGGIEYSNYKGLCSPAYVILRKKHTNTISQFFKHYFKTYVFIQNMNKNIEGIRDGKMVSYKHFSELKLPLPFPAEQQKIADCLSSIDEQINVETQKLETLKQHKKGLMQQLFPNINH